MYWKPASTKVRNSLPDEVAQIHMHSMQRVCVMFWLKHGRRQWLCSGDFSAFAKSEEVWLRQVKLSVCFIFNCSFQQSFYCLFVQTHAGAHTLSCSVLSLGSSLFIFCSALANAHLLLWIPWMFAFSNS